MDITLAPQLIELSSIDFSTNFYLIQTAYTRVSKAGDEYGIIRVACWKGGEVYWIDLPATSEAVEKIIKDKEYIKVKDSLVEGNIGLPVRLTLSLKVKDRNIEVKNEKGEVVRSYNIKDKTIWVTDATDIVSDQIIKNPTKELFKIYTNKLKAVL